MSEKIEQWYCRVAPSLGGGFAGTPEEVWGVEKYNPKKHIDKSTVFFGVYGFPDFFALWRHKGTRMILWAGSDIRHLRDGYFLNSKGTIRISPAEICKWINEYCISYVENKEEQEVMSELGIDTRVVPSFLGNVEDFPMKYKHEKRPRVYVSVSGDDFKLYKWKLIDSVAKEIPWIDFYLYGNNQSFYTANENVFVMGRMDQEQMDKQINSMTAGLRMLPLEGCSEVIVKSALWGQWPISRISYPPVSHAKNKEDLIILLKQLKDKGSPNLEAREWFLENLNTYPWNSNL